jgi:hypothetical protein
MDPHSFSKLDPDQFSPKKLDPDPHKDNAVPKHCFTSRDSATRLQIRELEARS